MSYGGRPAPRPGELFHYGPPRPPRGNFNTAYARSDAGASSLPPPQRPFYPERSYDHPTASVQRPPQRSYGNPQYYPPPSVPSYPRAPSSNGGYNNNFSSSSSEYAYPLSSFMPPRRPSIPNMTDDRSRPARQPPSSHDRSYDFRDDHYGRDPKQRPNNYSTPPQRGYRPSRSEASFSDDEQAAQSNQQQHGSGEAEGAWSWNTLKKTVWGDSTKDASQSQDQYPTPEDQVPADSNREYQNTLWARIANVGASFQKKINGDEGYASDATDYEGESHLIRIMKKYHVENAESAHDLPDWLFTQEELEEAYSSIADRSMNDPYRAANGRRGRHDLDDDDDDGYNDGLDRSGRGGGGLSDIYESVDRARAGHHSREPSKQSFDSGYGSSSASRRPKRFEEEPIDRFEEQRPLGRNRLGSHHHPRPASPNRSYRSQPNESFRRPMNPMGPPPSNSDLRSISGGGGGGRSMAGGGRQFDPNPPFRPMASGPSPKSTYDYFRPSGQDDRYPSPQPQFRSPPPPSSSGMRPQRR